jgi:CubicO group peptidase (beta-lactamase class C family)
MPPERVSGAPADARADQYAFAVTMYEALHGERPPTKGGHGAEFPRIDALLARALSREPGERYGTMRELLDALAAARPTSRARWRLAAAAIAIAALIGGAAWARHAAKSEPLHARCGGADGACPSPLICRFGEGNACGAADPGGVCTSPTDACDGASPAACGCDGKTYPNACEASRAGVTSAHRGACRPCGQGTACADLIVDDRRTASFCRAPDGRCGDGARGTCAPRPARCAPGGSAACGCDGVTYENACAARRAGVDVASEGRCGEQARAAALPELVAPRTGGLAIGAPDERGLDTRPLLALTRWVHGETLPIFSLLVAKDGVLVYEMYTSGLTREHAHYLMGATLAFTSTLVGVAIDRGLVPSLDATIADALPREAFPSDADRDRFRAVTVRDVLGMSALDAPVPPHDHSPEAKERQRRFVDAPNRATFALGQPLLEAPGQTYQFTDVTPLIASGLLEYTSRKTSLELAEEALFGPMGFRNYEWMHQDPAGVDNGAYGLRVRPIDLVKLGVLYLQEGVWEEKRLVSRAWTRDALTPWMKSSPHAAGPEVGAYFWRKDFAPADGSHGWVGHVVSGWKGQRLAFFPAKGVVVVMTGALEPPEDEAAIFRRVVVDHVVPAVDHAGTPDAAQRKALEEELAATRATPPRMTGVEPRMVPSIAPKGTHHPFRP